MKTRNRFAKAVIVVALLPILATACGTQSATVMSPQEIESTLIAKEQQKWNMFRAGTFSQVSNLYADDFVNVSSGPAGTFRQNKKEADAALTSLAPMDGEITLSDFLVVHPTENTAAVSYKVTAFFGNEYVTSIWALRANEWVTVFYQATPILEAAAAVADEPVVQAAGIPFAGRYLTEQSTCGDEGKDLLYLRDDGSYAVDVCATGQIGTTGRFEIQGNLIVITDDDRTDVPVCKRASRTGSYQFTYTGDTLTLTKVNDDCADRVALFEGRVWSK